MLVRPCDETAFYARDVAGVKRERPAGAVLALTPDRHVILARQYRPGPGRVLLELPGGFIEPGEQPVDAITRELLEETGYQGQVRMAGSFWHDAYSDAQRIAFVATDCIKAAEPNPERTEFIDVITLALDEFRTRVLRTGQLTDAAAAYRALDLLDLL